MIYVEPFRWITTSLIGLLLMIINGHMLNNEIKKIKSGSARYTTKYLKLASVLCFSSGTIAGLSMFLKYFNGFCYFAEHFASIMPLFQPIFIGFYQLSRIFYCFSRNKVYSDKGYSNSLFIIMYVIGAILAINVVLYSLKDMSNICGINKKYQYYFQPVYLSLGPATIWIFWFSAIMLLYLLWDITTMLLYLLKIKSFKNYKNEDIHVYKRILSILYRVLIPTLFYEIMSLLFFVFYIVRFFVENVVVYFLLELLIDLFLPIMYNYSMSLILEHNTSQYIKFLKFLYYFKLHFICCCCKYIVVDHLKELNVDQQLSNVVANNDKNDNNNNKKEKSLTTMFSNGISENHGKIEAKICELSVETTIKK
eukprot:460366_1